MSIFLSQEDENKIIFFRRSLFTVSSLLNALSMFCLLQRTPPKQMKIRNYIILIQVEILLIVNDICLDVLFEPIPLFPLLAGYCLGLLCKAGLPMRIATNITILLNTYIGIAILLCVFYRHQTLLPTGSLAK
ncbi:hypothetical protein PFISCL1PPCAC_14512, partial [Pristionchus fissidentatus]